MKRYIKHITILAALLTISMGSWADNTVKQGTVTNATVTFSKTSTTATDFATSISNVAASTTVYMKVKASDNYYIQVSDISLLQTIASTQAQARALGPQTADVAFTLVSGDVADLNGEHVYSFTMPASGADVKVDAAATACTSISSAVVTVSLSKEYTGTTLTADPNTVSVMLGTTPLSSTSDYDITTNAGGIDVNSYPVVVTGKNTYCGTATGSFTITKKQITIKILNQTISYGQSIIETPSQADLENGDYAMFQSDMENYKIHSISLSTTYTQASSSAYKNGITGTDAVIYDEDDNDVSDNYVINYKPGNLKINPKEVGLSWGTSSFSYDGATHCPTATATGLIGSDVCTVTVTGAQTEVGSYTGDNAAKATALSNSNYALPTATTHGFEITGATITVTASGFSGTYDGNAHSITVIPTPSDATVTYSLDRENYSATNPTFTNAVATTTVYYKVTKTNFTTVTGYETVKIDKAQLKSITLANSEWVYNGSGPVISEVTAQGGAGDIKVTNTDDYSLSGDNTVANGAGAHYTLIVTAKDGSNFSGTAQADYTILPADLSDEYKFDVALSDAPGVNYNYDGSAKIKTVTVTNKDSGNPLTITTDYTVSYTNNTNAGTATVTVNAAAGSSYYGSQSQTFDIAKAPLIVTAKNKTITYGDAPTNDGVTITGFVNNETSTVVSGSPTYTYTYTQYGDVGGYTITPVVSGLSATNYSFTPSNGTLTVNQKTLDATDISWGESTFTYDGLEHVPTATVASGLVNGDACSVTVTGGQTNAGTYNTATASSLSNANYVLSGTSSQSFTINKFDLANAIPTADIADQSYTGSQITPTATGLKLSANGAVIGTSEYAVTYGPNQDKGNDATIIYTANTGSTNFTGIKIQYFNIINAANSFIHQPSITGWTYGQSPNAPTSATADFGTPEYKFAQSADAVDELWKTEAETTFTAGTWYVKAFVEADANGNYGSAKSNAISFTIAKATPTIETVPTTGAITKGQKVSESTLTDGAAKNPYNNAVVGGTYTWSDEDKNKVPDITDSESTSYGILFTPTDAANYNTASTTAMIKVNHAAPAATITATHTATSITVTAPTGDEYEYSINGTDYQSSATFSTDVTQNTVYTIYARYKATEHSDASAPITGTVTTDHAHNFSYSVNGNVLTATCNNTGCGLGESPVVTLTLTAAGGTYDGTNTFGATTDVDTETTGFNAKTGLAATVAIVYTGTPNGAAANSYNSTIAPTNAGSYTATATVTIGESNYTLTMAFTVAKAASTITTDPTASAITYGETLASSELTGGATTPASGTFTWDNATTAPTVADSETTEYDVTFTPTDANNYETATTKVKLTVNAKAPTAADFTYTAPESLVYSGTAKAATIAMKDGITGLTGTITVNYYKEGETTPTTPTNGGTYVVKIDVAAGGNYAAATGITAEGWTFTITPKAPTAADFTYTAPTPLDFDGSAKVATVTAKTDIVGMGDITTIKYYKDGVEAAPVEGGLYQVKITVAAGTNYSATTAELTNNDWTFTIGGATPTADKFTYTAPASLTYDGSAKAATVIAEDGITGMGAITLKYYKDDTETAPINIGTYTVKINVAAGTNYTAVTGLTDAAWTFTITTNNTVPTVTVSNTTTGQNPSVTVKVDGKTLTSGTDYTVTYHSGSPATDENKLTTAPATTGTYYALITAAGNYGFDAVTKQFTVSNPAPTSYSISTSQPQHGHVSVNRSSGTAGTSVTVTATADEGYYVESITVDGQAISGNTFSITRSHTVSAVIRECIDINGATVTLSATEAEANGQVQKPTVTGVTVGSTALTTNDYTVSYDDGDWTSLGSYTVTVTGKGHYKGTATTTFLIVSPTAPDTDEDASINIGATGKSTYVSTHDLDFTNSTAKAYIAVGYDKNDKTLTLSRIYKVPAGTPIMVKGDEGLLEVPFTTGANYRYQNMLVGNSSGSTVEIAETDGDKDNYVMSGGEFKTVVNNAYIPNGKAYLQLPSNFPAARPGSAMTVSLPASGKSTLCASVDLDFSGVSGMKAYAATGYNVQTKTVMLSRVLKASAGTPVVLKGQSNGSYTIPSAAVQATYVNMFVGNNSGAAITVGPTSGPMVNYYLSSGEFVAVVDNLTVPDGKAYLQLPASAASRTRGVEFYDFEIEMNDEILLIRLDGGEATDIEGLLKAAAKQDVYYNLNGQRTENPRKGIYLQKGRKVVIK